MKHQRMLAPYVASRGWSPIRSMCGIMSSWVESGPTGVLRYPLDATPLPRWSQQSSLLRCRQGRGAGSTPAGCSIHIKKPDSAMIDRERERGYIHIYPYRNTWDCTGKKYWSAKWLGTEYPNKERERERKNNAWIDGLIQEDDGIHKCINIEIQFRVQIDSFVLQQRCKRNFRFNHGRFLTALD